MDKPQQIVTDLGATLRPDPIPRSRPWAEGPKPKKPAKPLHLTPEQLAAQYRAAGLKNPRGTNA